jgi:sulfate adenylyltransferase
MVGCWWTGGWRSGRQPCWRPARLPALWLTAAEQADLRALASGAYSPLVGFLGAREHALVTEWTQLPDGILWPIPVCLGLPDGVRAAEGGRLLLRGSGGGLPGVLEVTEVYRRDRELEAELVYGTSDLAHPGMARVLGAPRLAVAWPCRRWWRPWTGRSGRTR